MIFKKYITILYVNSYINRVGDLNFNGYGYPSHRINTFYGYLQGLYRTTIIHESFLQANQC